MLMVHEDIVVEFTILSQARLEVGVRGKELPQREYADIPYSTRGETTNGWTKPSKALCWGHPYSAN